MDRPVLSPDDLSALQAALTESVPVCDAARKSPASSLWLKPSLQTDDGASQVYALLQQYMERPEYVTTLAAVQQHAEKARITGPDGAQLRIELQEVEQHWASIVCSPVAGGDVQGSTGVAQAPGSAAAAAAVPAVGAVLHAEAEALGDAEAEALGGGYIMVQKEEVLEAMGTFIAGYIANVPEARGMRPEELQSALGIAFREIRKSRLQHLWDVGRSLYRAAAVSYAAFSMFNNPWLAMALMKATWAAARFLAGAAL